MPWPPHALEAATLALQRQHPGATLTPQETLDSSPRSWLQRCLLEAPGVSSRSVVVKAFPDASPLRGWVRETAALSVVPRGRHAPALLAEAVDPPVAVLSDLGTGTDVADALLGTDPLSAELAVVAWASAIADLHAATVDAEQPFAAALHRRHAGAPLSTLPAYFAAAAAVFRDQLPRLGIGLDRHALTQIEDFARLLDEPAHSALTPADSCPDNNLQTEAGLTLLDFESAEWRHVAWDAAYLVVPWASCWCAWQLPTPVKTHAMRAYVDRLQPSMPYVGSADFRRDVALAGIGWTFLSVSWLLERTLRDDWPADAGRRLQPPRRAMVLTRLGTVAASPQLPALARLAGEMYAVLSRRWGPATLPVARAFR